MAWLLGSSRCDVITTFAVLLDVVTVVTDCSWICEKLSDKFDFIQDDKEQLCNFRQYRMEDDEIVKLIQELFDNIDSGKALEFYQNKV